MTDERRYGEEEVGEIFALATSETEVARPAIFEREGLTLAELQEVGREVGVSPERVARAASMLDVRLEPTPRSTTLGAPVSVGRTVELPRGATDREWGVLVAELRETFGRKGRVTSHGENREWTSGNLHVYLEPTVAGFRLRLVDGKRGVLPSMLVSLTGLSIGSLLFFTSGLDGATFRGMLELGIPAVMAVAGGGLFGRKWLRLRRWAAEREDQMEHIATRARELLGAPPIDPTDPV